MINVLKINCFYFLGGHHDSGLKPELLEVFSSSITFCYLNLHQSCEKEITETDNFQLIHFEYYLSYMLLNLVST